MNATDGKVFRATPIEKIGNALVRLVKRRNPQNRGDEDFFECHHEGLAASKANSNSLRLRVRRVDDVRDDQAVQIHIEITSFFDAGRSRSDFFSACFTAAEAEAFVRSIRGERA